MGVLGGSFWLRFFWESTPDTGLGGLGPTVQAVSPSSKSALHPPHDFAAPRIDINHAPQAVLESLPRIGPKRAGAIVAEREANGPFRSAEDLLRVPGIGPATLKIIAPHLYFTPSHETSLERNR